MAVLPEQGQFRKFHGIDHVGVHLDGDWDSLGYGPKGCEKFNAFSKGSSVLHLMSMMTLIALVGDDTVALLGSVPLLPGSTDHLLTILPSPFLFLHSFLI